MIPMKIKSDDNTINGDDILKAINAAKDIETGGVMEVVDSSPPVPKKKNLFVKKKRDEGWWKSTPIKKIIKQTAAPVEREEQRRAFDAYIALGDNRNITQLAKQTQIPRSTLARWCTKFKWAQRIIEMNQDHGIARSIEPIEDQVANKRLIIDGLNFMIKGSFELDEERKVIGASFMPKNVADFERCVALRERVLYGDRDAPGKGGQSHTQIGQAVFIIKK